MAERTIVYFDKTGPDNTDDVMRLVDRRVAEGGIAAVAVATTTGKTALRARELIANKDVPVLGIAFQPGADTSYPPPEAAIRREAEAAGVRFIPDEPLVKYIRHIDGESPETLRHFGQGIKVAIEVTMMAAEAGMVEEGATIIGVGGSSHGADAAVVVRCAKPEGIKSLWVHEILCKPG